MIKITAILLCVKEISYIRYLIREKQKLQAGGVVLLLVMMLIAVF